ncbi:hypothetical protein [Candidatus Chlorohelix sp.]|uniref:TolB family protein n=1 Tax=Candidatus Chlorohelix sp. TaxID=3139201 RepID=UPI00304EA8F6
MADKKTKPPRSHKPGAGPLVQETPSRRNKASGNLPPPKRDLWNTIRENFGWGLIIGLPVIIVVLALFYRATDGFSFKAQATAVPLPTVAPTPTAGSYVAPPQPSANQASNRVLFLASPDPQKGQQIFTANPDGSDAMQLTNTPEIKSNPVWSPDGKQIAFTAQNAGVQIVNYDGSGLHTLAYNSFSPVWSPDSKKIAFLRSETAKDGRGPNNDGSVRILYIINADGKPSDEQAIAYDAIGQNWSPDGNEIVFFSLRNLVAFTVEPKLGATVRQVTLPNNLGAWFPAYTPDGKNIIFYGTPNANYLSAGLDLNAAFLTPTPSPLPSNNPTTVATTTASGTSTTPLLTPTATPSPTPMPNQVSNLYSVNRDGSGLKTLTTIEDNNNRSADSMLAAYINNGAEGVAFLTSKPYYRMSPAYSADGKRVAVPFITKDFAGIQLVNLDGAGQPIKIIAGEGGLEAGTRLNPTFSVDGTRLYYLFQPTARDKSVEVRSYDLNGKSETPFVKDNTYGFPTCCGFKK